MAELIPRGTWVEIHGILLRPEERAPQLPKDTAKVPLEMRARGFLSEAGAVGEAVEVLTAAGRRLRGTLSEANPAYLHSFGAPVPELTVIGREVRPMLRGREGNE